MASTVPPHGGRPVDVRGRPLGEGKIVLIMVHGRDAGTENILGLVPAMPSLAATYLAPAAAGGTWYPKSFLSPIEQNEPGITSGISVIHGLIDDAITAGVRADHIVLLGFSQGACLAVTAAERRPARYGGLCIFSGGLIGPPGTVWSGAGDFGGTPVLLGCCEDDPHIPEERVHETATVLQRMGAAVDTRMYPAAMGHMINGDEMMYAHELVTQLAAR
ncbi:MAG: alpha/beta hydrolase [Gemmatimonadales bacterium]